MASSAFTSESGARARRQRGGIAGMAAVKAKYGISVQQMGGRARQAQWAELQRRLERIERRLGITDIPRPGNVLDRDVD
jgi:hypothetical protein